MKRIIMAVTMVLLLVTMLSGCRGYYYFGCVGCYIPTEEEKERKRWREEQEGLDEEKAASTAQAYLEEKYGEEFIYASNNIPPHRYPKDLIVVCKFKRKNDEKIEEPVKYYVDVVYKLGEYTVVGDDYMFVYIRKVAEDFLRPYVEKHFSDIEHVFFLRRADTSCGTYLAGEYLADAKIPQSFDELCDVTSGIAFKIIVPISEDQNKVSEACSLLKSDLEELNMGIEIEGWIDVYQNDHFDEIRQSSDPRRDAAGCYSREQIM